MFKRKSTSTRNQLHIEISCMCLCTLWLSFNEFKLHTMNTISALFLLLVDLYYCTNAFSEEFFQYDTNVCLSYRNMQLEKKNWNCSTSHGRYSLVPARSTFTPRAIYWKKRTIPQSLKSYEIHIHKYVECVSNGFWRNETSKKGKKMHSVTKENVF